MAGRVVLWQIGLDFSKPSPADPPEPQDLADQLRSYLI
jgi:hypothetical protein